MNEILTRTEDGTLVITLDRPTRKNSITAAMYVTLREALASVRSNDAVRVVVLEGSDTIFSAGNDLQEFLSDPPVDLQAPVFRFLSELATCPKPVIAAVCGPAVGVGVTMLFHCDVVYAGENASFSMPFTSLGLCPEAGSALLGPQVLGYHPAAEALLFGEAIDATTALKIGLVNKLLAVAETRAFARERASTLAKRPLTSLVETKRLLKHGRSAQTAAQMDEEHRTLIRMLGEPAARDALEAFARKRVRADQ